MNAHKKSSKSSTPIQVCLFVKCHLFYPTERSHALTHEKKYRPHTINHVHDLNPSVNNTDETDLFFGGSKSSEFDIFVIFDDDLPNSLITLHELLHKIVCMPDVWYK